ncbi:MAG: DUF1566 domain-containing protein [Terracidiphilus sp.]|jgi:hypothetical protein
MSGIRLLLATIGLSMLSACGSSSHVPGLTNPGQQPPTDTVSGTVQFKGAPLAGATVTEWLTNTNTVVGTATTDASGNYSFSGLVTSSNAVSVYQFWVSKTGYGFYPSVGSGAEVIRFDHTGNYQGNGATDTAIYFTVIQFDSLANDSLTGADFNAYDGSNPLVSLPSTGQGTSYAAGDDGSLKKGIAWPETRFTSQNGTVIDNLTGLIWLQNAGCFSPTTWAAALTEVNSLASGTCGLTDGSKAGDWRMPNLNELESLVDASQTNPALTAGNPFTNVSNAIYWSSTSYFGGEEGSPDAWAIRMSDGRYMNDSVFNVKATSNNAVWAVKGAGGGTVKLQSTGEYVAFNSGDDGSIQAGVAPTFQRWVDNADGTITDTVTGLIWLKKADCINQPWSAALAAVNTLASGQCGLTDNSTAGSWRMPNRNEMQSLSDRMETNHADFFDATYLNFDGTVFREPIFTNFMVSQYYWTSTTDAANTSEAWTVFSCDYGVYDTPKSNASYTLAVR